ncbi:hypothetical protein PPERSA_08698 [Pseudocohnilembus persalinus]|uniref:Uncharacterized protein n=1 Tax=Pseudocohnilembus persalinus TaxID=266149 RepID=A0A0V0R889_PSEPJ|nr:hypothetical protein PPERSA_08698 [Pseudocohnilembus persalinus]|eukprot:KRX10703.1 hypothetical protein PPERSA_08698 [Pseudocohnilembus persalinus]
MMPKKPKILLAKKLIWACLDNLILIQIILCQNKKLRGLTYYIKYLKVFKHSTDFRESCIKIVNNLLMACSSDTDMAQIMNQIMPQLLEEHNNANQLKNTQQIGFIIEQLAENMLTNNKTKKPQNKWKKKWTKQTKQ